MCNRCGCQRWGNEEEFDFDDNRRCENRNVRQLICAAERFVREENREMRCCEHRCECQFRNCMRRCHHNEY